MRLSSALFAFACVILASVTTAGPAAYAQTYVPAELADQRRWNSIADLLRAVEPAYSLAADRRAATDAVASMQIAEMLAWSGEAGVLLMVPIQQPETESEGSTESLMRLGTPVMIGVGANPLDAACAGLSPGPMLGEIDVGMRYAPELSRFVWVNRESNRLRFRHISVNESSQLRARAARVVADDVLISEVEGARYRRIINGIAAFARQRSGPGVSSDAIEAARSLYDQARSSVDSARRNQKNWRTWGERSVAAHELVADYQSVITFTELRSQAQALAIPALNDRIRATRTAAALQLLLMSHVEDMRKRLSELNVQHACQTEIEAYAQFFESLMLSGEVRDFVRQLLPARSTVGCLPANS